MKLRLYITLALSLIGYCAAAQNPKKFSAPLSGTVVLGEVKDKYCAEVFSLEMPEIEGGFEEEQLREVKEQISKLYPHKNAATANKKTTTALSPIIGKNFLVDTSTGIPPDNYMAISKDKKAISVVNSSIEIYDGSTGSFIQRKSLKNLSASVGLNSLFNDYRFDPKVVYDPEADRYILVMLNGVNQYNYIVVGFSKTNDPVGAWNFYKVYGDYTHDTTWFDYPAISITKNEFFLTGNKIKYDSSWQAGFSKTLIYQINKQSGYNGDTALSYQIWDNIQYGGKYLRCLYPLNPGDHLNGPEQYFLSNRNFALSNDSVFLVKVPDTIGGSGTITVTPITSGTFYGAPPNGRQPDTAHSLATNDGRVLGGFIQGNEIQYVHTSVDPVSGSSAIYHGIISNYATTPTATGHIYAVDTLDFGYPNISYAGNGGGVNHAIITLNYSGPTTFPSFGGVFFDGANYSDLLKVKGGSSSISILSGKEQRWGDYSGSQPQWDAPGVVWAEGIFGGNANRYSSQMVQLISPYFTQVKEVTKTPVSNLFPNPAYNNVGLEFTIVKEQAVTFAICDINGKVIDNLPVQLCHEGRNLIQFNVASLPSGTYFLKGTGTTGEKIATHQFVKH